MTRALEIERVALVARRGGYSPAQAVVLDQRMAECRARGWWANKETWAVCGEDDPAGVEDVPRLLFFLGNDGWDGLRG